MSAVTVKIAGFEGVSLQSSTLATKMIAATAEGDHHVRITRTELAALLGGIDRGTYTRFFTITTDTEPKWAGGKKNPHNGVRKLSKYSARFREWSDALESQAARDGVVAFDYAITPTPWREYVGASPVCEGVSKNTKGSLYLALLPVRNLQSIPTTEYYDPAGGLVDQEAAKAAVYKAPQKEGAKQHDAGIEKALIFRTPKLDNIHSLTLGGYTFSVE